MMRRNPFHDGRPQLRPGAVVMVDLMAGQETGCASASLRAPSHYGQGRACPRRDRLPGPARAARAGRASRAASSKPNVIMFTTDDQTVRDMVAMPKTQALIGNAGRELPARVRLDVALLPLAGHGADRRVRAQPPASWATRRRRAATARSTTRTTCRSGCSRRATARSTSARCRTASARTDRATYVPPGWGPFNGGSGQGRVLRLHRPALRLHRLHARRERRRQDLQRRTTTRPTSTRTSRSIGSTTTSPNFPNSPLYMQVQFFAPHDPATPATEVPERLRHRAAADRRELQREERQGQARLDPRRSGGSAPG